MAPALARLQAAATSERAETLLRGACAATSAAAALLLGLSAQTKTVLFVRKKAVPRDVEALWVLIVAAAVAAGYHAARLVMRLYWSGRGSDNAGGGRSSTKAVAWISFLLDKGCAYVVFATSAAALSACFVALTGVEPLQWSRLCNIYTRFCVQGAFGMVCGLAAAVGMAILSAFSARDLFRLYSPPGHRGRRRGSREHQSQAS